ncbi:MAG: ABC transporter ATP-binding protein [Candidatus Eremiobacterota bacterium]
MTVLRARGLTTRFGSLTAVNGVSFDLTAGRTLAVVGESGSGKSVCALSVLGLVSPPGKVVAGQIVYEGRDLLSQSPSELRRLRGDRLAMVFQDPLTSLNPVLSIGVQVAEPFRAHRGMGREQARACAVEALRRVGIPRPEQRVDEYPHQFSGGMRQRVGIAMALALKPAVVIADEPTTALDVTIQAQVLELLRELQREDGAAVMLITHDMGVVAQEASETLVMYAGQVVEQAPTVELFRRPLHPYTAGLMASVPRLDRPRGRLHSIPGQAPDLRALPPGCPFAPRCALARPRCRAERPPLEARQPGRLSACFFAEEAAELVPA